MDTEKLLHGCCPVGRGVARAGDAWTMLILRDAGLGLTRFDEFQRSLGIAPNILTRRLAALVKDGLLERCRYSERPPRDEYILTDAGCDYLPVLHALGAWQRRHFGGEGASHLVEAATGRSIDPVVVDRTTGQALADLALNVVLPD